MPAMPGMGGGAPADAPLVSAFHHALLRQGLVVLALLVLVAVAWQVLRGVQLRQVAAAAGAGGGGSAEGATRPAGPEGSEPAGGGPSGPGAPEPPARHLLRIGFGLLWLFDGLLQGQSSIPGGMVPDVLRPAAAGSPAWVHGVAHVGVSLWSGHPVTAAAAAVWIQVGLGLWLLAAPRGRWSRAAGVAGAAWGLVVWVFAEAFGGLFAPDASWLFGAPGAALLYAAAGALLALPERRWADRSLARGLAGAAGASLLALAVLQAWPGRGMWTGRTAGGAAGPVAAMVGAMAHTPQPPLLAGWVSAFAGFAAGHGAAVNAVAVLGPALAGVLLLAGRPGAVRLGVGLAAVLALADWVLVQDLGFLGGVGTDPNSMVPALVLLGTVALAVQRAPAPVPAAPPAAARPVRAGGGWAARLAADPTFTFRVVAALAAVGVVLVGAAPMAAAALTGAR